MLLRPVLPARPHRLTSAPSFLAFPFHLLQHIVSAATTLKIRVTAQADINALTLRRFLHLMHEKLSKLLALGSKAELVDAVRELVQTEAATSGEGSNGGNTALPAFLHPLFADIYLNADSYKRQMVTRPRLMEIACGVLLDAVVDAHRLGAGRDVFPLLVATAGRGETGALQQLLQKYLEKGGPEALAAFIERPQ